VLPHGFHFQSDRSDVIRIGTAQEYQNSANA
jgi:hypothetical protein